MQLVWLEKLAHTGQISKEARDEIYRDCSQLLKTATGGVSITSVLPMAEANAIAINAIKGFAGQAAAFAGGVMGYKAYKSLNERMSMGSNVQKAEKVRKHLLAIPELASNKERLMTRFGELVKYAPNLAMNQEHAERIIKEKLHSGFRTSDLQALVFLNSTIMNTSKGDNLNVGLAKADMKKSAAATGEMLATVCHLVKEASVAQKAVKAPEFGATMGRALTNALAFAGISGTLAVGAGGVNHYIASRDKKELKKSLDKSFLKAMEVSDPDREPLHANKDKARAAFQTLAHFAPHVAAEPYAARAFMSKLVNYDMAIQPSDIKDLTSIEENIGKSSKGNPFFSGLASGSEMFGLKNTIKDSIGNVQAPYDRQTQRDLGLYLNPKPEAGAGD